MKKVVALLALALASAALVACGSGGSSATSTSSDDEATSGAAVEGGGKTTRGGSTVKFEAAPNGQLAYTTTQVSTKAGKVTIEFDNEQSMPHDVAIEDSNGDLVGKTDVITESSATTTVDLKPGTYKFYCSVPGHREAGMEGTLTVE